MDGTISDTGINLIIGMMIIAGLLIAHMLDRELNRNLDQDQDLDQTQTIQNQDLDQNKDQTNQKN